MLGVALFSVHMDMSPSSEEDSIVCFLEDFPCLEGVGNFPLGVTVLSLIPLLRLSFPRLFLPESDFPLPGLSLIARSESLELPLERELFVLLLFLVALAVLPRLDLGTGGSLSDSEKDSERFFFLFFFGGATGCGEFRPVDGINKSYKQLVQVFYESLRIDKLKDYYFKETFLQASFNSETSVLQNNSLLV